MTSFKKDVYSEQRYGEISTTMVSFAHSQKQSRGTAMDKKVVTVATVIGTVSLLNYYEKLPKKKT